MDNLTAKLDEMHGLYDRATKRDMMQYPSMEARNKLIAAIPALLSELRRLQKLTDTLSAAYWEIGAVADAEGYDKIIKIMGNFQDELQGLANAEQEASNGQ